MEHPAHDRQRLAEPAQPLGKTAPEWDPERVVLLLEPGASDPEDRPTARDVVEVVAILAVRAGSRNVLAPTIRPIRTFSVACAHAASISQPSNIGPSELPTIG